MKIKTNLFIISIKSINIKNHLKITLIIRKFIIYNIKYLNITNIRYNFDKFNKNIYMIEVYIAIFLISWITLKDPFMVSNLNKSRLSINVIVFNKQKRKMILYLK